MKKISFRMVVDGANFVYLYKFVENVFVHYCMEFFICSCCLPSSGCDALSEYDKARSE